MAKKKQPKQSNPPTKQHSKPKNLKQIKVSASSEYRGPIPPPEILYQYNEYLPGSADRILTMAEKQSIHRQELEKVAIKSGARDSLLGLIFGYLIGTTGILGSVYCIVICHVRPADLFPLAIAF
jgi:uncharacterized membrane protein